MFTRPLMQRTSWIAMALIWLQLLLPVVAQAWAHPAAPGAAGVVDMAEFCTMPGMAADQPSGTADATAATAGANQGAHPGSTTGTTGAMSCALCCACAAASAAVLTSPARHALPAAPAGRQVAVAATTPAPRPAMPLQRLAARAPPSAHGC